MMQFVCWQDKHNIKPAWPFGHGLTYGNTSYSGLQVTGRTISFQVTITGGCDTPQVYIGYPKATVDRDVSEWDVQAKAWHVVPGKFAVYVGSSSQDIRLSGSLTVA
jgi:beta-glucosidase